jgi:hypothetical protein
MGLKAESPFPCNVFLPRACRKCLNPWLQIPPDVREVICHGKKDHSGLGRAARVRGGPVGTVITHCLVECGEPFGPGVVRDRVAEILITGIGFGQVSRSKHQPGQKLG